jgi:hypothetical protein
VADVSIQCHNGDNDNDAEGGFVIVVSYFVLDIKLISRYISKANLPYGIAHEQS